MKSVTQSKRRFVLKFEKNVRIRKVICVQLISWAVLPNQEENVMPCVRFLHWANNCTFSQNVPTFILFAWVEMKVCIVYEQFSNLTSLVTLLWRCIGICLAFLDWRAVFLYDEGFWTFCDDLTDWCRGRKQGGKTRLYSTYAQLSA